MKTNWKHTSGPRHVKWRVLGFVVLVDSLCLRCVILARHTDVVVLTWHLKIIVVSKMYENQWKNIPMAEDTSNDVSWALYFFNSSCPCPPRPPVNRRVVVVVVVVVEWQWQPKEKINHKSCDWLRVGLNNLLLLLALASMTKCSWLVRA